MKLLLSTLLSFSLGYIVYQNNVINNQAKTIVDKNAIICDIESESAYNSQYTAIYEQVVLNKRITENEANKIDSLMKLPQYDNLRIW